MSVDYLSRKLSRLRADIRRVVLAIGFLRLLLLMLGVLAAAFLFDWLGRLAPHTRITTLAAGMLVTIAALIQFVVRPLRVKLSDDALALLVERRFPEFKDRLISAVQLARRLNQPQESLFNSPSLVNEVIAEAAVEASARPFREVLRTTQLRWLAAASVVAFAAAATYAALNADMMRIWMLRMTQPYSGVQWPRKTTITLPGFDSANPMQLARGDTLSVDAECEGRVPSRVTIYYSLDSGRFHSRRMETVDEHTFRAFFASVTENVTFYVSGGDHQTERYEVHVVDRSLLDSIRPRVDTIQVSYEFPQYTRLSGYDQTDGLGDITGVVGTKVRIAALSNKPLSDAKIVFDNGGTLELEITDGGEETSGSRISGEFTIEPGPASYRIEVTDSEGMTDDSPVTYRLRAIIDNPPVVRVISPRGNREMTANAAISVSAASTDERDFGGIRETRFVMRKGEDGREISRTFDDTQPGIWRVENSGSWELSELSPQEGDLIQAWVEAEDYNDVTGPGIGRSEPFYITIVSPAYLDQKLDQKLESVKGEIREIQNNEEQLKAETDRLAAELLQNEELETADINRLQLMIRQQKNLAERTKNAGRQLQEIAGEMLDNKIGTEDDAERLESHQETLEQLAGNQMADAAAKLEQAYEGREQPKNLRLASTQQHEIIEQLDDLLRQLSSTEDIDELIRQASRLVIRQKSINDRTRAVGVKTLGRTTAEMDDEDRAVFRALERDQTASHDEMRNLESDMGNFVQKAKESNPAAAEAVQHAFQQAVDDRIHQNMQLIAEILEQMSSAKAVDIQENVHASLERLLENLIDAKRRQYADTEQLRREMEAAAEKLDELIRRQQELQQASDPFRAEAIEQARQKLEDMIEAQENLKAETAQRAEEGAETADLAEAQKFLEQQVEELARQLEELSDPNASQEVAAAAQEMQRAQQQLGENQPAEAQDTQAEAIEQMKKALDELEQAAQQQDAEQLAEKQRELQREAEQLASEMQALAQQAQSVDENTSERMQDASQSSSEAGQHMQQASDDLAQDNKEDAQEDQQEALDKLAEAREQLQQAQQALDEKEREKMLFEIGQVLAKMLAGQREVNARTIEIDENARQEGELTRKLRLMLQETATVQQALKEQAYEVNKILQQEGSAVFLFAMTQVTTDMEEAEQRLEDEEAGWSTQQVQKDIERTLAELVESLKREYDRTRENQGGGGGNGGGQPGGKQPLVPPLAELKMLRTLQVSIFDATQTYEEEKILGRISEPLLQRRIQRLGERQEKVSKTARQLARELERQMEEQGQ